MTREELERAVVDDYEVHKLPFDDIVRKWKHEGMTTVYRVRKLLVDCGVEIRPPGPQPKGDDIETSMAVYDDYMAMDNPSMRVVADDWGRSHEWVRQRIKEAEAVKRGGA